MNSLGLGGGTLAEESGGPVRRFIRRALPIAVAVLVIVALARILSQVDWPTVAATVAELQAWQVAVLLACLALRQWLNAQPLAIYVDGIGRWRAVQNQQAAILLTIVAPPPSDLVLRMRMFRSWGVSQSAGLAGTILNSLVFYVVCFTLPLLGAILLAATGYLQAAQLIGGLLLVALSAAIVALLRLSQRDSEKAGAIGYRAGAMVRRVRRSVKPEDWRDRVVEFQATVSDRAWRRFPRAFLALVGMIVVETGTLVLSVRFAGVGADQLAVVHIVAALFIAYPLVLLPFSGLGVLDTAVIATLMIQVGVDAALQPRLIAAFLVWRITMLLLPILLGLVSLAVWKVQTRDTSHHPEIRSGPLPGPREP